jgi:TP901 family phage tail tape measure protein
MAAGDLALNLILKATDQTGGAIGDVSRELNGVGGPLKAVAGLAVAAGAGMAGLAIVSIKSAADLQQSVTQLVTTANEDAKNVGLVTEGIKNMAIETATSTDQLAKGMYVVESAGYHGATGLKVLQAAAQGAKTENADLGVVTKTLTAVMTDYHMQGTQATSAMDGLIKAVSLGNTNLQSLALAMGNVLPIASSLHISFPQVAGAMSIMTNAGMTAQRASMNLAFALRALGAPSSKAQGALQEIGISAEQLHKVLMNQGLPAALQMIEDHLYKKFPKGSAAAVDAYKTIMGGAAGYNVALMIANGNLGAYEGNINLIAQAMKNAGGSVEGFEMAQQNFNFKMDQAKQAVQVFLITIGQALLPIAGQFVSQFAKMVQWVTQYENKTHLAETAGKMLVSGIQQLVVLFNQMVEKGQQVIAFFQKNELAMSMLKGVAVGLFAVIAAGFAIWAINAAIAAAASVAAAAPFILLGAAVAAVAGLFIHFYQTSPQFKSFIDNIINGLRQAWMFIQQNFLPVVEKIGQFFMQYVWPILVQVGQYIGNQFKQVWADLVNMFNTQLKPSWDEMVKAIGPAMPALKMLGELVVGIVIVALVLLAGIIVGLVKALAGLLSGLIAIVGGVTEFFTGLATMIEGWMAFVSDLLTGKWSKLGDDLKTIWTGISMMWKGLWDTVGAIFQTFWYVISGLFTGLWDTVVGIFTQIYNDLVGHSIVPDIINGIISWFNKLPTFFTQLLNNILNWFKQQWDNILKTVQTAWTNIATLVQNAWTQYLQPKFNALMAQLTSWGNTLKTSFGTWATNAINWFATQITNGITGVKTAVTGVAQAIKNIIGIQSPAKEGPLSTSDTWMPNMVTMFAQGIDKNAPKVTAATNRLATTINTSFTNMNANVNTNVNSINSKMQLLSSNTQTQSANVSSQFTALSTNVSQSTASINTSIQNVNTNVSSAFQQVGQTSQQASSTVNSAASSISTASQAAVGSADFASSGVKTSFGNTTQYATQSVQGISQSAKDMNSAIDGAKDHSQKAISAILGVIKDGLIMDGKQELIDFVRFVSETAQTIQQEIMIAANGIGVLLGHSVPKEGPLKDDDKWGLHFTENIVNGIKAGTPAIMSATNAIASTIKDGLQIDPSGQIQLKADLLANSNPSANNKPMVITVHLDKKVIAKAVTNYQQTELRVQGAIRGV